MRESGVVIDCMEIFAEAMKISKIVLPIKIIRQRILRTSKTTFYNGQLNKNKIHNSQLKKLVFQNLAVDLSIQFSSVIKCCFCQQERTRNRDTFISQGSWLQTTETKLG